MPRCVAGNGPSTAPIGKPVNRHPAPPYGVRIANLRAPAAARRRSSAAPGPCRSRRRSASRHGPELVVAFASWYCPAAARPAFRAAQDRARRQHVGVGDDGRAVADAKPVPRNSNCGARVRSKVPTATTDALTRAIVSHAGRRDDAPAQASAPASSKRRRDAPQSPDDSDGEGDVSVLTVGACREAPASATAPRRADHTDARPCGTVRRTRCTYARVSG